MRPAAWFLVLSLVAPAAQARAERAPNAAIFGNDLLANRLPGVVMGSSATAQQRRATCAALQAGMAFAAERRLRWRMPAGEYDIECATGLVTPAVSGFEWDGSRDTTIKQFATGAPILVVGDISGGKQSMYVHVHGARLAYGVDQTGQQDATALRLGSIWASVIEDIAIDSAFAANDGLADPPLRSILIDAGQSNPTFFFNVLRNILIHGAQHSFIEATTTGTQNVYENMLLTNTSAKQRALPLSGPAISYSTKATGQFGDIWTAIDIEHVTAPDLVTFQQSYSIALTGWRFEQCHLSRQGGSVFHFVGSTPVVNGLDLLNLAMLSSEGASDGAIFNSYGGQPIVASQVNLHWSGGPTLIDRPWMMAVEGSDRPLDVAIAGLTFDNAPAGFRWDANIPSVDVPQTASVHSYVAGDVFSEVRGAVIPVSGDLTVYGQTRDPTLRVPTGLGAPITITLSDHTKSTGLGAAVRMAPGRRISIMRAAGPAGPAVAVRNADGTVLQDNLAPAATARFLFDGTRWAPLP